MSSPSEQTFPKQSWIKIKWLQNMEYYSCTENITLSWVTFSFVNQIGNYGFKYILYPREQRILVFHIWGRGTENHWRMLTTQNLLVWVNHSPPWFNIKCSLVWGLYASLPYYACMKALLITISLSRRCEMMGYLLYFFPRE